MGPCLLPSLCHLGPALSCEKAEQRVPVPERGFGLEAQRRQGPAVPFRGGKGLTLGCQSLLGGFKLNFP